MRPLARFLRFAVLALAVSATPTAAAPHRYGWSCSAEASNGLGGHVRAVLQLKQSGRLFSSVLLWEPPHAGIESPLSIVYAGPRALQAVHMEEPAATYLSASADAKQMALHQAWIELTVDGRSLYREPWDGFAEGAEALRRSDDPHNQNFGMFTWIWDTPAANDQAARSALRQARTIRVRAVGDDGNAFIDVAYETGTVDDREALGRRAAKAAFRKLRNFRHSCDRGWEGL